MSNPDGPKHPISFFFHFSFKVAVFFWYVFCTWFSDSFVTNFVVAVILLALDFWTVKNVTGRFLVGLRFWNEVSPEGGSAWRFETLREGDRAVNSAEKWWFWVVLVVNPAIWCFFGIVALLRAKLEYLIIPVMGIILGSSNMIGYFKCSKEAKSQLQNMSTSLMQSAFTSSMNAAISRV